MSGKRTTTLQTRWGRGGCIALAAMVLALALVFILRREDAAKTAQDISPNDRPAETNAAPTKAIPVAETPRQTTDDAAAAEEPTQDAPVAAPLSAEEKAAAEAEAHVEAFDGLTDRWMEPAKAGITMQDVDTFVAAFKKIPRDRQDECIHRALNLVPDDNALLLVGVLMDKSIDKEIVETVFSDILNRDEDVKKPILKQVFADKTHPCWADTAWILDVTGEKP